MKILRYTYILTTIFLIGCMAKVEDEDVIDSVSITSHEIERTGSNAKIILHGVCPKYTSALKINAANAGFDVIPSSMTNPSAWVEQSGVPIGECNNGILRVEYPVPNPFQSRIISFKIKAKMPDGKISLYAALRDVDYSMAAENLPGYAVTSGGGFATTGLTVHASAGIVHGRLGNVLVSAPNATLRAGLQGILYNDTIY